MSNIEDDVKILTEENSSYKKEQAINNILAEREQDKKKLREYWNNNLELAGKIKELEKYTIHLTDEQYRKVIENAQKDIAEQKDKRIQELEADLYSANEIIADLTDSIPKQKVIDALNRHKFAYEEFHKMYNNTHYEDDEIRARDFYMTVTEDSIIYVLQELLEGEK